MRHVIEDIRGNQWVTDEGGYFSEIFHVEWIQVRRMEWRHQIGSQVATGPTKQLRSSSVLTIYEYDEPVVDE